jgi:hypothetical protein
MAFSVEGCVYVATYAIYTEPADDARYTDWVAADPEGNLIELLHRPPAA